MHACGVRAWRVPCPCLVGHHSSGVTPVQIQINSNLCRYGGDALRHAPGLCYSLFITAVGFCRFLHPSTPPVSLVTQAPYKRVSPTIARGRHNSQYFATSKEKLPSETSNNTTLFSSQKLQVSHLLLIYLSDPLQYKLPRLFCFLNLLFSTLFLLFTLWKHKFPPSR